jgi:hypothetical protein
MDIEESKVVLWINVYTWRFSGIRKPLGADLSGL